MIALVQANLPSWWDERPIYSFWAHMATIWHDLIYIIQFNNLLISLMFFGGAFFAALLWHHIITTIFDVRSKRKKWILTAIFFILYFPLRHIAFFGIFPMPDFLWDHNAFPAMMPRMSFRAFQRLWNNFHYAGLILVLSIIIKKVSTYLHYCLNFLKRNS